MCVCVCVCVCVCAVLTRALTPLVFYFYFFSHWGKSCQRSNRPRTTYVDDPEVYVRMMTDETVEVTDLIHLTEEMIALVWNKREPFEDPLPHVNMVMGAYTTAQARLKLYSVLERLQHRALYFDTDSVIFTQRDGEWEPPTGEFLGDLKCETDGEPITAFVSGGPKNYAYRLASGQTTCKIRGFTLGSGNAQLLNFETMEQMVLGDGLREGSTVEALNPFNVRSDRSGALRSTGGAVGAKKIYRLVYDKRVVQPDGKSTLPFGWSV